jgi:hypothetical protein
MWIYTSTPIRIHGVVLNYLSTGTTLPYLYYCELHVAFANIST